MDTGNQIPPPSLCPPGQLPARRAIQLGERPLWVGDKREEFPSFDKVLSFFPPFGKGGRGGIFRRCLLNYGLISSN
ncbi:MAG: hypothetical protein COZ69_15590 [Deltaproteobacteria bacterium CG_4_8_14_3_um_filter_45_9]|nr:MAG: hypothetical protein COZ69_15590 [Deltaproteobacteria bacterium CG_4_8_14_3_um_filter_45_9]